MFWAGRLVRGWREIGVQQGFPQAPTPASEAPAGAGLDDLVLVDPSAQKLGAEVGVDRLARVQEHAADLNACLADRGEQGIQQVVTNLIMISFGTKMRSVKI